MKAKILLLSFCLSLLMGQAGFTQETVFQGKVTAFRTIPLNKASITLKSQDKEILSDSTGFFTFSSDEKEKITISAMGFYPQKIKLASLAAEDSLLVDLRFKKGKKNFQVRG